MRILLICAIFFSSSSFADVISAAKINAQLGLAYLSQGYYAESKTTLLTALHEGPNLAVTWYSMAYFLEKTGHLNAAEKYYQKAISVDPHSGSAKNNYGTFLCRLKHYHQAIKTFLFAAQEKYYLHPASAYANAGTCAMKIPDLIAAKKYLVTALNNNPTQLNALLQIARLNVLLGHDSAAKRYFVRFEKISSYSESKKMISQQRTYIFKHAIKLSNAPQ